MLVVWLIGNDPIVMLITTPSRGIKPRHRLLFRVLILRMVHPWQQQMLPLLGSTTFFDLVGPQQQRPLLRRVLVLCPLLPISSSLWRLQRREQYQLRRISHHRRVPHQPLLSSRCPRTQLLNSSRRRQLRRLPLHSLLLPWR